MRTGGSSRGADGCSAQRRPRPFAETSEDDCDIILDTILNREAQEERNLRLSKPYHLSGVALALRPGANGIDSADDLAGRRIGTQVGSIVQMLLGQRGVRTIPFGFEDDMIDALAKGEIDGAAISPLTIGYFNLTHPEQQMRLLDVFASEPDIAASGTLTMLPTPRSLAAPVPG